MPIPALRAVARKTGASMATVEREWRKAKPKVKPEKGAKRGKHSYAYLMGTVANMARNHMKHLRSSSRR